MKQIYQVPLFDLSLGLSEPFDHACPAMAHHHRRVACLAFRLGEGLMLDREELGDLVVAAAIHDLGSFSLEEHRSTLAFEVQPSTDHADRGYHLLRGCAPFRRPAEIVRFHHVRFDEANDGQSEIPLSSRVLHLADRVDTLIDRQEGILTQIDEISAAVGNQRGKMFPPNLVDALEELAEVEAFWLEIDSPSMSRSLARHLGTAPMELELDEVEALCRHLSYLVDFKSHFTAGHSSGVAAIAESLARGLAFSEPECKLASLAGLLHDLGKLGVPAEIIDKPGKLTDDEFATVRTHPYFTQRILDAAGDLQLFIDWAAPHHERLDGTGYPYHLLGEHLPLGARVLAAADVLAALTEDRPHRPGAGFADAIALLNEMAEQGQLDPVVVAQVSKSFDELETARMQAQARALGDYQRLKEAAD